jgi:hypothetical protein
MISGSTPKSERLRRDHVESRGGDPGSAITSDELLMPAPQTRF